MYHKKYEFDSLEQWETLKLDLPHEMVENQDGGEDFTFTCEDTIVILDELPSEFDENGSPTAWSGKYHIDALWSAEENEPDSWKPYLVQLDNIGAHGFAGVTYIVK